MRSLLIRHLPLILLLAILLPLNGHTVVAVVNHSALVSNADAARYTAAIGRQVHEHLAPAWKVDADVVFVPEGYQPPEGAWVCALEDRSRYYSSLGVHFVNKDYTPACEIEVTLAKTLESSLADWPLDRGVPYALSHEILEMLVNPFGFLSVFNEAPPSYWNTQTAHYTAAAHNLQICDPVAGVPGHTYWIDGVMVTNFTLPAYWDNWSKPVANGMTNRLDYLGLVATAPLKPLNGGYTLVRTLTREYTDYFGTAERWWLLLGSSLP